MRIQNLESLAVGRADELAVDEHGVLNAHRACLPCGSREPGRSHAPDVAVRLQKLTGFTGANPRLIFSTRSGAPFSHTSSMDRFGEKPWWRQSAGIAAISPAFMI